MKREAGIRKYVCWVHCSQLREWHRLGRTWGKFSDRDDDGGKENDCMLDNSQSNSSPPSPTFPYLSLSQESKVKQYQDDGVKFLIMLTMHIDINIDKDNLRALNAHSTGAIADMTSLPWWVWMGKVWIKLRKLESLLFVKSLRLCFLFMGGLKEA